MSKVSYILSGGYPVFGDITCLGAKNLTTKCMVASLLTMEKVKLKNAPQIGDVEITQKMLESSGSKVTWLDSTTMLIDNSSFVNPFISLPDSRTNRIPILMLGTLIHRFEEVFVPVSGGDNIGKRDVNFHIEALKQFGVDIEMKENGYLARKVKTLQGCNVKLPYPSVGATETCLYLGVLSHGITTIQNAAIEPEIVELITMLRCMGAIIFINLNREIVIYGVNFMRGVSISMIGDRIEAASWACLACASNGKIRLKGINPTLISSFLSYFQIAGGGFELIDNDIIDFYRKEKTINSIAIETDVYPGFSTDYQQPFGTMLTQGNGASVIHETVHDNRFGYLSVLNKLGASTNVFNECLGKTECRYNNKGFKHSAVITGPTILHATDEPLIVPDIRAGLAYFIAAIISDGQTKLLNAEQIERGYGNLEERLKNTNIKISRTII